MSGEFRLVKRESNVELFRIVATFMILFVHCNGWFLRMNGIDSWYYGGWDFAIVRTLIQSTTCIGVDCFILISGFFSIKPKLSSIINMFSLLFFFYVGTYLYNSYIGGCFSWRELLNCCLAFSKENWFIQCYLFLMLLSPVLNAFVENIEPRRLLKYVVIYAACSFYFGCIIDSKYFYFNQGYSFTTFILVYLVGMYIRIEGESIMRKISSCRLLSIWILVTLIMSSIRLLELPKEEILLSYCSPLQIVSASVLFLLFLRINLKSQVVNFVASSCLAVFILHTCQPVIGFLSKRDYYFFTNDSLIMWLVKIGVGCVCVFVVAIFLDKIRMVIFTPLIKYVKNR